jgi:hypothetical protein
MAAKCPRCGADNKPRAKFCNDCGAPLNASTPGAAAVESRPDIKQDAKDDIAGERRHLTVLFSISLDRPRSPAISIRSSGAKSSASTIARRRTQSNVSAGMSRSTLGDGVIAYFGYTQGLDDDAERAARAGLAILAAITRLNDHPARPKLAARVGIDSGTVVVGAGAGKDSDVFGDTPNIAARVQAAAEPGTVVITDTVHRLISGLFVVEDGGAQALKGIERPLQLYRVIQTSRLRGRLEAGAAARGLAPFVGREDELRLLMNRWERAIEGERQMALVVGEAGIGKSRLVQRLRQIAVCRIPGLRRRPAHCTRTRPSTRLLKCFANFWHGAATSQRKSN